MSSQNLYRAFGEFAEKAHRVIKDIETLRKELFEGAENGRYQTSHAEITLPRRSSGGIVKKSVCYLFVQINTLRNELRAVMEDQFDIGMDSFNVAFFRKNYQFSPDEPQSLVEMIDDVRQEHFIRMELENQLYRLGLTPIGSSRTVFLDIDESNFVTHTFLKERNIDGKVVYTETEGTVFHDEIHLIDSQIRDRHDGALLNGWEKNLDGDSFIKKLIENQKMITGEDYIDGVQSLARIPKKLKEAMITDDYV